MDLRTFVYLDQLQPQVASFLATVSQGFLPTQGQASLYVEVAPGISINTITDVALKQTRVKPGMQIVERAFGVLEVHHDDQGEVRAAGDAILRSLEMSESDRMAPKVVSTQVLTGMDSHHTMLINRMRHGNMVYKGDTMWVLETLPAGYALFAANEAEKASPVQVLEIRAVGAFGRLYLSGGDAEIEEAAKAAMNALASINGRPAK
ncbi:MAG: hypothetical protein H7338_06185 [Candidatus Sericytochromatia bacterium]|nr:hypothetical protein [Candidatus Sericytochromatia bacterium]